MVEFDQVSADDANLRAGIGDLAGLVAGSRSLSESLAEIAGFAVRVIPGADGVGVALLRAGRPDDPVEALSASAAIVEEIDRIQYVTLDEGPSLTAVRERCTVRSESLGGDRRWPRFGPRVGRLGVHSVLALPLVVADQVVGAITVYAYGKDTFDEHAAELGELFAKPAAVAVHNAQVLADAQVLTTRLQAALVTRPVIDQAVGLIRGRTGRSAEDALSHLRAISQAEQRKLVEVAQSLVDEAVRRARARQPPDPGV
jgi:GAF domain-containing protein